MKIRMVPVGGRIKSAAVGLDVFNSGSGNFQDQMKRTREHPPVELLNAFFPSDAARMKQMMRGIGFYRPMLKTDQGMGGNFLPFHIDRSIGVTDLSVRKIVKEEGLIIPELYLEHSPETLREITETFRGFNLHDTYRILEPLLSQSREAEKGRTPFFFIRPAQLSSPIVFGDDIVQKVTSAVQKLLGDCDQNFLYFLADVFITTDGKVTVEKLHFPDVGFFMIEIELEDSIAFETQGVVRQIRSQVFKRALELIDSRVVYIVTRDEVLHKNEDVLEILEIRSISRRLQEHGVRVEVKSMSQVGEIPAEAICFLMNLDYNNGHGLLLERYGREELVCHPSPHLQLASRELTGLRETVIPSQFMDKFFSLVNCSPRENEGAEAVASQIETMLSKHGGIMSDFLHVDISGREIVPVHRRVHHSWKRMSNRIIPTQDVIKIREIPLTAQNSMITSSTGPRVHVFRFTFTAE